MGWGKALSAVVVVGAIGTILLLTGLPEADAPQMSIDKAILDEESGELEIEGHLVGISPPIDGPYHVIVTIYDPNDEVSFRAVTDLKIIYDDDKDDDDEDDD